MLKNRRIMHRFSIITGQGAAPFDRQSRKRRLIAWQRFGGERKSPEKLQNKPAAEKCIAKWLGGDRKAPKVAKGINFAFP